LPGTRHGTHGATADVDIARADRISFDGSPNPCTDKIVGAAIEAEYPPPWFASSSRVLAIGWSLRLRHSQAHSDRLTTYCVSSIDHSFPIRRHRRSLNRSAPLADANILTRSSRLAQHSTSRRGFFCGGCPMTPNFPAALILMVVAASAALIRGCPIFPGTRLIEERRRTNPDRRNFRRMIRHGDVQTDRERTGPPIGID